MTPSSRAASRTSRANGPIWSSRAGERDDAVAADAAVSWLQARPCRYSAAGWRIEPPVSVPIDSGAVCRDGRCTAAAAAARDAIESHGLDVGPIGRELRRRAHRELVHVRLAREYRAGSAQPLRDVRVVRADVSVEDGAAGGRGSPRVRTRSLSATGMPSSAAVSPAAIFSQLRQPPRACDSASSTIPPDPGVKRVVGRVDPIDVSRRQLNCAEILISQAGGHLARRESGQVGGQIGLVPVLAEDWRHQEIVARSLRCQLEHLFVVEAWLCDVLAQDVLELDRLRRRRDVFRVQLGEGRVLIDDVIQLALEARQLLFRSTQARKMGDVFDVAA